MKLTCAVRPLSFAALMLSPILLLATPSALAQTRKPVHHHRHAPVKRGKALAKTTACGSTPQTTTSALIPAVTGCPTSLYALSYIDTQAGTGASAAARKFLTVNYTGYLTDGTKFDTSVGKQPITFPYGAHQVITGWDTGFQGMMVGGKRRLYIPYQLAYGESGHPPVIPAKAQLIFDVELLAVSDTPPGQPMPAPKPAMPAQPAATANPSATANPTANPGAGANPASTPAQPATPPPSTPQTNPTQPKP